MSLVRLAYTDSELVYMTILNDVVVVMMMMVTKLGKDEVMSLQTLYIKIF